jgi:hypothetical protein
MSDRANNQDNRKTGYFTIPLGREINGAVPLRAVVYVYGVDEVTFPLPGRSLEIVRNNFVICKPDPEFFVGVYEHPANYGAVSKVDIQCPLGLTHIKYPIYCSEGTSVGVGQGVIFAAPLKVEVIIQWKYMGEIGDQVPYGLVGIRVDRPVWVAPGIWDLVELEAVRKAMG